MYHVLRRVCITTRRRRRQCRIKRGPGALEENGGCLPFLQNSGTSPRAASTLNVAVRVELSILRWTCLQLTRRQYRLRMTLGLPATGLQLRCATASSSSRGWSLKRVCPSPRPSTQQQQQQQFHTDNTTEDGLLQLHILSTQRSFTTVRYTVHIDTISIYISFTCHEGETPRLSFTSFIFRVYTFTYLQAI